jgi:hypothetical protein
MHRHTLTIHAATQLQLARQKHNAISPPAITAAIESSLHGMPVRPRELLHGSDRTRTLPRRRPSTSTQPAAGTTTGAVNTPPIRMAIYLSIYPSSSTIYLVVHLPLSRAINGARPYPPSAPRIACTGALAVPVRGARLHVLPAPAAGAGLAGT